MGEGKAFGKECRDHLRDFYRMLRPCKITFLETGRPRPAGIRRRETLLEIDSRESGGAEPRQSWSFTGWPASQYSKGIWRFE